AGRHTVRGAAVPAAGGGGEVDGAHAAVAEQPLHLVGADAGALLRPFRVGSRDGGGRGAALDGDPDHRGPDPDLVAVTEVHLHPGAAQRLLRALTRPPPAVADAVEVRAVE